MKYTLPILFICTIFIVGCMPQGLPGSPTNKDTSDTEPVFGGISFDFSIAGCGTKLYPEDLTDYIPQKIRLEVNEYDVNFWHSSLSSCCYERTISHERIGTDLLIIESMSGEGCDDECKCEVDFSGVVQMLVPEEYTVFVYEEDPRGVRTLVYNESIEINTPLPEEETPENELPPKPEDTSEIETPEEV